MNTIKSSRILTVFQRLSWFHHSTYNCMFICICLLFFIVSFLNDFISFSFIRFAYHALTLSHIFYAACTIALQCFTLECFAMDCFFYLIPFSIYCFCLLLSCCLFSVVLLFKSLLLPVPLPLLWRFLVLFFHHCFCPLYEVTYSAHSHFGPALRCQSKFNFVYSICTYRSFLINPLKCMHISIILNNTNVLTTNLYRPMRMEMSQSDRVHGIFVYMERKKKKHHIQHFMCIYSVCPMLT